MARARGRIRSLRIALAAIPVAWFLSRSAGCTGRDAEIARALNDASLLDTFVADDGRSDARDDAAADVALDALPPDAAPSAVLLGVNSGIAVADASAVELSLAELQALGAGSRAGSFVAPFDALIDDSGKAIAPALTALGASCQRYAAHGARVALNLALVDRVRDARPSALRGDWTSSAALDAVDTLIDQALAVCGGALAYLGFGYEADRYLAQANAADRAGYTALVTHALDHARAHSARPSGLGLAVGFSLAGFSSGNAPAEQAQLLAASDVVLLSALPLVADFQVEDPVTAVARLSALSDAFAPDSGAKPLVLAGLSYPSASGAGSSPFMQDQFFEAFFRLLAEKRERFPFVTIDGLFDPADGTCSADSALYAAASDPSLVAALCSVGLEARGASDAGSPGDAGSPAFAKKPAELRVFTALASFRSP